MKAILPLIAAVALLALGAASPASAGHMSLVDHPDVPNCTVFGPNDPNCETVNPNTPIYQTLFTKPCDEE